MAMAIIISERLITTIGTMTTTTTPTANDNSIILDSLPYVDAVHEDYEEYALALIEEEMKQFQPRALSTAMPSINFRTPLMQHEYHTLVKAETNEYTARNPQDLVESLTFQLKDHLPPNTTEDEYRQAIRQARSQYEAERIRGTVLEVEKEVSGKHWKDYNDGLLQGMQSNSQFLLQAQCAEVEEINYQRQQAQQQQLQPQLQELEQQYQTALYKRNQLEHAICGLKLQKQQ
jgi:hypothetical protein